MIEGFFSFLQENREELFDQILEHLWLTMISVGLAAVTGIALGILITRIKSLRRPVLILANGIQTIPSIALLGVLLPLVGIGPVPAIIALFLYGLLPIIRNTYAGITGVDPSVREAAMGIGLSHNQRLIKIELPLATPVIFAGIRTAFVINVGVATLCALIAAGGLGEFIFRGLATNNPQMILAGAVPAAGIALLFDAVLGFIEKKINKSLVPLAIIFFLVVAGLFLSRQGLLTNNDQHVTGGFPSEFIQRGDGYPGLDSTYNLNLSIREMEIGLMYDAVRNGDVDVISGFSTDGRIVAFDLAILEDDKNYFPPYHAAPLIRGELLRDHPELGQILNLLEGVLTDSVITSLNYMVDEENQNIREVAQNYITSLGLRAGTPRGGGVDVTIGSKNFTESFILAEMFAAIINGNSNLNAVTRLGFGGTKLLFDALNAGDVDIYPEYTGTGLLVILQPENEITERMVYNRDTVYQYVQNTFREKYDLEWLLPLGFNNTFALMTRKEYALRHQLKTISDLARHSHR